MPIGLYTYISTWTDREDQRILLLLLISQHQGCERVCERVCGMVEGVVDIRNKRGWGRGGGLSGYRWAASLDLKQSRDLAATISWGRLFHSGMVRGKMTHVCTVSCSRGCCSCVYCSFCGLIWFLLAVVGIQNQW